MARNDTTSAIIDGLLRYGATGGMLGIMIFAPNAIQALDKPIQSYFSKLDKRAREHELRRITGYMKKRGLVTGDYEHGLILTKEGQRRLKDSEFEALQIATPNKWDNMWRLVIFDIPERHRKARNAFTVKLRTMGFQQLQQSVWIHPYPCRTELEKVCVSYDISKYVTYIETNHIDHEQKLIQRFRKTLNFQE